MTDSTRRPVTEVRLTFNGDSKLDEAIRKARPRARSYLLRCFAETGLKVCAEGSSAPPADLSPWDAATSGGAVRRSIVVRLSLFPLGSHDPLSDALRDVPTDVAGTRLFRAEQLRSLAAVGLAIGGQPVFGRSAPIGQSSSPAASMAAEQARTTSTTDVAAPEAGNGGEASIPAGLLSSVHLA